MLHRKDAPNENVFNRKLIPGSGVRLRPRLLFNRQKPKHPQPIKPVNSSQQIPIVTNPSLSLSDQDYYQDFNIFTQFGAIHIAPSIS